MDIYYTNNLDNISDEEIKVNNEMMMKKHLEALSKIGEKETMTDEDLYYEVTDKLCKIIDLAEDARDILDEIEEPKEDNTFENVLDWLTAIAKMYSKSDTLEIDIYDFVARYNNGESKEVVIDRIFHSIDKLKEKKGAKNYNLRKRIWE